MSAAPPYQCPSRVVCSDLVQLLYEFGMGDDAYTCSGVERTWPCPDAVHNVRLLYDSTVTSNSQLVMDFISPLFANSTQLLDPHFTSGQSQDVFYCSALHIDIYAPCAVDSCVFHTQDPWVKNCILYYRIRHDRDMLNLNELAFLLRRDVGGLRASLTYAFRMLSKAALKEVILRDCRSEMVSRIVSPKVCVVCEKSIDADDRIVRRGDLVYCGRSCYGMKSPQIIGLEQEFKLGIERLLILCIERFSNIKNMSSALSMGPRVFVMLCNQYGLEIPAQKLI